MGDTPEVQQPTAVHSPGALLAGNVNLRVSEPIPRPPTLTALDPALVPLQKLWIDGVFEQ